MATDICCQAGKGDAPRNNSSRAFRENFEAIDWGRKKPKRKPVKRIVRPRVIWTWG